MRPFIFMVTFWGPTYRQYFVDRSLASLLAPGNFPQLHAQDGHRLLIATTLADWQAIDGLPIMQAVRRHVTPTHLEMEPPAATPPGSVPAILQQNRCHKLLLDTAYSCRTYACMLWPDIIFSDGLCVALQRWAAEGQQLVLFASLRHVQEAVLDELAVRNILPKDARASQTCRPLTIAPRDLADISVRHLHPEVLVYEFEDSRLPVAPVHVFARISDGRGIALHTFHGQQILMDFGAIATHDTDCLTDGLFEDAYIDRNFAECRKIHVVRDSDEFGILSLTPASVGSLSHRPIVRRSKFRKTVAVLCRLRAAMILHTQNNRRRIRRDLFREPILWHTGEFDGAWTEKHAQLDQLLEVAAGDFYSPAGQGGGATSSLNVRVYRLLGNLFYRIYVRRAYLQVLIDAAKGDREAWQLIGRRIRRLVKTECHWPGPLSKTGL